MDGLQVLALPFLLAFALMAAAVVPWLTPDRLTRLRRGLRAGRAGYAVPRPLPGPPLFAPPLDPDPEPDAADETPLSESEVITPPSYGGLALVPTDADEDADAPDEDAE